LNDVGYELGLGVPYHRLTLGHFVRDIADRHGDLPALVAGDRRVTYAELSGESKRIARALLAAGVTKGARVGVLMGNRPEMVATLFAIGMVGGVGIPMSTFAVVPERDHVIAHSDMSLLVLEDRLSGNSYVGDLVREHPDVAEAAPGGIRSIKFPFLRRVVVLGETAGSLQEWEDFLEAGAGIDEALLDAAVEAVLPHDDALTIYTSGTTAEPKAVLHLHRAVVGQFWRWAAQMGLGQEDRVWSAFPFFWSAGIAMVLGGTLASGASLYIDEVFDAGRTLEVIERERITTVIAFPHTDAQLADHPDAKQRDLSSVHNISTTSAFGQLCGTTRGESAWDVRSGYGSSETFTVSTALPNDAPLALRLASHGLPLPGMRIRVVDVDTGTPLPPGESGEITVKGFYLMRTYYKAAPEDCFDDEGWFHTKDAGHLDEEGYLHWHGRISGMIKTGGSNVSPVEVETRAMELGLFGVVSAAGVPHPLLGEAVVMCAVPLEGVRPDEADVLARLRAVLARYKVPRRVLLFEEAELHFTASEKVLLEDVRRLAAQRIVELGDTDDDWVGHLEAFLAREPSPDPP